MSSKERIPKTLREALWDVHGRRCVYTGDAIATLDEVEIDHVLPERLADDEVERSRVLADLGLSPDFAIQDNRRNLVPTTRSFNRAKSDKTKKTELVSPAERERRPRGPHEDRSGAREKSAHEYICQGLALAARNFLEVEKSWHRKDCRERFERLFAKMPPGDATQALGWVDKLTGGTPRFPDRTDLDSEPARVSRGAALLSCYMPSERELGGQALLLFKSLKIRDAMIDFDHRDLLETLFRGFGGVPDGARPVVVAPHEDGFFVQVQHVRFWLQRDDLRELCEVVDVAAPAFLRASERVERRWRSLPLRHAARGYRLCDVSQAVWDELVQYAHDYVVPTEHSPALLVTEDCSGMRILDGLVGREMARLHAEPSGSRFQNVSVCWDPVAERLGPQDDGVEAWNADDLRTWLDAQVFPWILERRRRRSSWLSRGPWRRRPPVQGASLDDLRTVTRSHVWKSTSGTAFESIESMRAALVEMMDHYDGARSHTGLPAELLQSIYRFIGELAQQNKRAGAVLAAVARALPTERSSGDFPSALQQVNAALAGRQFIDTYVVHKALGALLELLGGLHGFKITDEERDRAASDLARLYEYTRSRAYLERLIARPW